MKEYKSHGSKTLRAGGGKEKKKMEKNESDEVLEKKQ